LPGLEDMIIDMRLAQRSNLGIDEMEIQNQSFIVQQDTSVKI
jgi:hypothetical protein